MSMICSVCRLQLQSGAPIDEMAVDRALARLSDGGWPADECAILRGIGSLSARAQSVGARLALLWALTEQASGAHDFDELPPVRPEIRDVLATFCKDEQGRPLLREQLWQISLAHGASLAVCALSDQGAIGVDVESKDRLPHRAHDIANRLFSETEQAQLARSPVWEEAFIHIWTRKEALGKMLGTGLRADPSQLDTTRYPDRFLEYEWEGHLICICQ